MIFSLLAMTSFSRFRRGIVHVFLSPLKEDALITWFSRERRFAMSAAQPNGKAARPYASASL